MRFVCHFRCAATALACAGLLTAASVLAAHAATPAVHQDITQYLGAETCLGCHASYGEFEDGVELHFMASTHWSWVHTNQTAGLTQVLGKRNMVNNYCIALPSNEPRCTSCHAGIGWRDHSFDFSNPNRIDCLVCHDTTRTYVKTPTGAGAPAPSVNLLEVARHAGLTSRATCGACHFYGGGGDAVKHGDLDSTMTNPSREADVHMGTNGLNQTCTFCHASTEPGATAHDLVGSRYSKAAPDSWLCEKCHPAANRHITAPNRPRLEAHVSRVACQTCHVPFFARGGKATKMSWDWSTAGQRNADGTERIVNDAQGNPLYDTKKGTFTWAANVVPEYRWFNGQVIYTTLDDTINPAQRIVFNQLQGEISDPVARIVPVKRFTGRQPYDAVNNRLVIPHLFATNSTDTAAYWKGYNWTNAIAAGMAYEGRAFSGQIGWVDSEMFWIQNHMVAPKEQALQCTDCHTPKGRLDFAALGYAPERVLILKSIAGFDIQLTLQGNLRQLAWIGTLGHSYQVQYCSDPAQSHWIDAPAGNLTAEASPTTLTWTDPLPANDSVRFYRVVRSAR